MLRTDWSGRMTEQLRRTSLTADAFLEWAMEQPSGRFELIDGEIVAMAPERAGHARAKFRATAVLAAAIAKAGLGCEALVDGMSVRVDDRTVFEPDALVRCGPSLSDDAIQVTDPVIVVEVLSPSTGGIDTGLKLEGYFRMPSVRHYLVVNTVRRVVLHHRRDDGGAISLRIVHEGVLELDPPGLTVDLGELFG